MIQVFLHDVLHNKNLLYLKMERRTHFLGFIVILTIGVTSLVNHRLLALNHFLANDKTVFEPEFKLSRVTLKA